MEQAVQFFCGEKRLFGILHLPKGTATENVVLMITGGPQTRYGSHRVFVQLARYLCQKDITVFRFDYEGMGDSDGSFVGCKHAGPSIHAAMEYLDKKIGNNHRRLIWSLCDGASASLMNISYYDKRLAGLILCNPLIHSEVALYRKHYYKERIFKKELWMRLLTFRINFREVVTELVDYFQTVINSPVRKEYKAETVGPSFTMTEQILNGIFSSRIPITFILSTDDVVAQEFHDILLSGNNKKKMLRDKNIKVLTVEGADHTFTQHQTKKKMFELTYRAVLDMWCLLLGLMSVCV
jgi:uncharacterized protein